MTEYEAHKLRWRSCSACGLCETRTRVVLVRGELPCDVLFVGEGPGVSENAIGRPFVGPAGKLLDQIIYASLGEENLHRTGDGRPLLGYALTNLIACIPVENGEKAIEPPDWAVEACKPRLQEIVRIANPKLIVCVGKHATDWLTPGFKYSIKFHREIPLVSINHPAHILRANIAQRGLMKQRAIVVVTNAVEDL